MIIIATVFTGTSNTSGGLLGVTGNIFLILVSPIVLELEGAVVTDFLTGVDGLLDLPTLIDLIGMEVMQHMM